MFNPGVKELDDPKSLLKLLKCVEILIVNKSEAAKMVPGVTLAELLYHLQNYAKITIITDGAMGGIATNGEETFRLPIQSLSAEKTEKTIRRQLCQTEKLH